LDGLLNTIIFVATNPTNTATTCQKIVKMPPQTSPEHPADARPYTEVAVGILIDAKSRMLMTSRPEGKVYAGYWEFPGGKVEPGEGIEQALARELHEELGIHIGPAQLWRTTTHSYEHAHVRLNFCKVRSWQGELHMREGQQFAWQQFPLTVQPVLPGAYPVLDWLELECGKR
jgi:8-oxo-dGTP diphosphatase